MINHVKAFFLTIFVFAVVAGMCFLMSIIPELIIIFLVCVIFGLIYFTILDLFYGGYHD